MTNIVSLRPRRGFAQALAGLVCMAACAPAWAALGGSQASVDADVLALHGSVASAQRAAFTVKTITLPTGTAVNEFITPGDQVAAVSWRGPRPPNLSQLLGVYYADYQTALAARQTGQHSRHLLLDSGRMRFESGGHMRDLHGSAWLPALMPQGASAGDLQ